MLSWKDPPLSTMRGWTTSISELEHRVAALVRPFSLLMLRVSLGVVFVWFGALKVANVTPVGALVAGTKLTVAVLAVGQTYPGANLTVIIRL